MRVESHERIAIPFCFRTSPATEEVRRCVPKWDIDLVQTLVDAYRGPRAWRPASVALPYPGGGSPIRRAHIPSPRQLTSLRVVSSDDTRGLIRLGTVHDVRVDDHLPIDDRGVGGHEIIAGPHGAEAFE